jgi:hypothetical protein
VSSRVAGRRVRECRTSHESLGKEVWILTVEISQEVFCVLEVANSHGVRWRVSGGERSWRVPQAWHGGVGTTTGKHFVSGTRAIDGRRFVQYECVQAERREDTDAILEGAAGTCVRFSQEQERAGGCVHGAKGWFEQRQCTKTLRGYERFGSERGDRGVGT